MATTTRRPKAVRKLLGVATALLLPALIAGCANSAGDEFPSKAIEYVVPHPAGGGTDSVARAVAPYLEKYLDVPVKVVVRSGGAAVTGTQHVIGEPADGYTVLGVEGGIMTTGPAGNSELPYDPEADLQSVGLITSDPWALVASKDSGLETIEDFIDKVKTAPEGLRIGIANVMSSDHYAWLLVQRELGGPELKYVTFGGGGPTATAVLNGDVDVAFIVPSNVQQSQENLLAVTGSERLEAFPDVPTTDELGLGAADAGLWQGLVVRSGTPDDVVDKLAEALAEAHTDPKFVEALAKLGLSGKELGPQDMTDFTSVEREQAKKLVAEFSG